MKQAPPEKISFYDQMLAIDVIDPILDLWHKGQIKTDIHKGTFTLHREIALNRTWTFAGVCKDRKCAKWLGIYFKCYRILPPPCKQCWKVVFAPSTVEELIEFQKFQSQLNLPGKCGTEARDYTSGLGGYRAFWYCPFFKGLEGGRAHFKRIKNALIKHFGEEYILNREKEERFYLKRGCTELERDFGDSDKWDEIDHSSKFTLLETVWLDPEEPGKEFSPLIYTNYKRWIEYAVAHNDKSAAKYLHTDKFGVQSVKYNSSAHLDGDFKPLSIPKNGIDEKGMGKKGGKDDRGSEEEEGLFEFESD